MSGRTVLLIDDDEDVAGIMGGLLAHAGYQVLHAGTLPGAKRLLEQAGPDVVVLEPYGFGRSRWTEVALLAGGARRPVPCVALTTLAGEAEQAASAGVRALYRQTGIVPVRARGKSMP
jgi:CheY-like chemotaxis protein